MKLLNTSGEVKAVSEVNGQLEVLLHTFGNYKKGLKVLGVDSVMRKNAWGQKCFLMAIKNTY